MKNNECNNALKFVIDKIDMKKINNMIDEINCMTDVRKDFYKSILNKRFEILEKVDNKIL